MNRESMYQQSIAAEFLAIKDRVRYFINDSHWGEDGRYKEIILMNFLRKLLPENVAVGTGFVKNNRGLLTTQIDIIIYKKDSPRLFSEGDFVVLMPESVIGIIEVKSKTTHKVLTVRNNGQASAIEKAENNGEIIGSKNIFNGIFGYENDIMFNDRYKYNLLAKQLKSSKGYLNHLALGSNNFVRYWKTGNPICQDGSCYSSYRLSYKAITGIDRDDLPGLSFGYFISNLLETVYRFVAPHVLNTQYFEFLYPLEGTKEKYRVENCEIILENDYSTSSNTPF